MLANSRVLKEAQEERNALSISTPKIIQQESSPDKPDEPKFISNLHGDHNISAIDYEIIKLTAKYTARNGISFQTALTSREGRNPQFEFLKAGHTLFPLFQHIVTQYTLVLNPSTEIIEKELKTISMHPYSLMPRVTARAAYIKYSQDREQRQKEEEENEQREMNTIDWDTFVVVDAVEMGVSDRHFDFPKPLEASTVRGMTMVQRRALFSEDFMVSNLAISKAIKESGGSAISIESVGVDEESEMEIEESGPKGTINLPEVSNDKVSLNTNSIPKVSYEDVQIEPNCLNKISGSNAVEDHFSVAKRSKSSVGGSSVKVRTDYIPGVTKTTLQTVICPICSLSIPTGQIEEHIRIESLDPKWREQRERYLAKHRESNIVYSGSDVASNLEAMHRIKSNLASMPAEEAARAIEDANRQATANTIIWDGRSDTAAVVSRQAMQRQKKAIEEEMAVLEKNSQIKSSSVQPQSSGVPLSKDRASRSSPRKSSRRN